MRVAVAAVLAAAPLAPGLATAQPATTRFAAGTRAADVAICVQPLGRVDAAVVAIVSRGIAAAYGFTPRTLATIPLPAAAYYRPRKRYRADKLLDHLGAAIVPTAGCAVVLGLTTVDISVTKDEHVDWGILGLAQLDSQVAVVSTFRTRKRVPTRTSRMRTVKVATHELGHALGLDHDDSVAGCMMNDAGGTVRTVDRESGAPCPHERAAIEARNGVDLPEVDHLDWAAILDGR